MRPFPRKVLLVVVLLMAMLLQLYWVFWPCLNLSNDSYRYRERKDALHEWGSQRTPESWAKLVHEHQLLDVHLRNVGLLMIAAVIVEGAAVIVVVYRSIRRVSPA